jgi:hypothetical protein
MNKAELESKPLSELHSLAAEAGVPRYRMLPRGELIERLLDGGGGEKKSAPRQRSAERERPQREGSERPPRRRRRRSGAGERGNRERSERKPVERDRPKREPERDRPKREPVKREPLPEPSPLERAPEPAPVEPPPAPTAAASSRPRRRRRRFRRRGKDEVTIQALLLPPVAGRQAILCAPTREGCTALLRGVAADLAGASNGPDPVVLLIDPSPEELADWKRGAPQAEIVAAGQARHASDALAQATARAGSGDDVILLVDSLSRFGSAYGDADSAKDFFDAGRAQGGSGSGSLTVVAALERPA